MTCPAERVLRTEAEALLAAAERLDASTFEAAELLLAQAEGPFIIMGVGTSGTVARKLAATFTSTGSRAVFLHPSDALHGQLGIVRDGDVVVAVSNSGETEEILAALPYLASRGTRIIAIVGTLDSTLGRAANVVLDARAEVEACPLDLAPTSSSTLALAVGDALAVGLMDRKGITAEAFARNHPSGRLGRRLLLTVQDLMQPFDSLAQVAPEATLLEVLSQITAGGAGAVLVLDGSSLVGIVTDGDVRRGIEKAGDAGLAAVTAKQLMTTNPETVSPAARAYDALRLMEDRPSQISVLPVVAAGEVHGLVRLHDLIKSGL
jgi:arabinose-5-phosphate isomerase